jgi:uncharacterized membrane protein
MLKVIIIIIAASLAALALVTTVIGALMPRDHVATSTITLKQPPDAVYALVRNIGGMKTWWRDLKVSTRITDVPGERWKQEASGFSMQIDIIDESAPHRFTTRIVEEKGAPFGGAWIYEFAPAGQGTTVSITEKGWIGPPPFRVIATARGLHQSMDAQLASLAKHYGEDVKPTHR